MTDDIRHDCKQLARRVQALPDNRIYAIIVVKQDGRVVWSVSDPNGRKIEGKRQER
jgi:hypothetical protein